MELFFSKVNVMLHDIIANKLFCLYLSAVETDFTDFCLFRPLLTKCLFGAVTSSKDVEMIVHI